MAAITTVYKTTNFLICHGFLGPNESHEMVLKGDGLAIQWQYCIFRPLDVTDDIETCYGQVDIFDRFGDTLLETKIIKNNTLLDLRERIGCKLKANINNNFSYYFSFNPIPYTDKYDCFIYDETSSGEFKLDSSNLEKYIIPITGSCFVNGKEIKEKQFATIIPNIEASLSKSQDSIIGLFSKS